MAVKVLVVDDSFFYRKILTEALRSLPGVEVVGGVANGANVLSKVRELAPDLITLDIEMPGMNGIEVMNALRQSGLDVKVLVVSSVTVSGGRLTMQALQNGAFDFITKPDGTSLEENRKAIRAELAPRLRAVAHRVEVQNILRPGAAAAPRPTLSDKPPAFPSEAAAPPAASASNFPPQLVRRPELVVIGVSTGGPKALTTLLAALPRGLGVPILIVQHMPPIFTQVLATNLSAKSSAPVLEAKQDEAVVPNTAYLAPGGKHMRLVAGAAGTKLLQLTEDPPENCCRPAVDYLFRSVAQNFPGKALAVILTGMGEDGTAGLRLLRSTGSTVIAQDEASCVVFGMPKAAIEAGVVDHVLPLGMIADRIATLVGGPRR
ncbi:MAG: chemotaxis-specific protein-glutamate methyltransferase CheB [Candidatus Korobacteraceae bacterium]